MLRTFSLRTNANEVTQNNSIREMADGKAVILNAIKTSPVSFGDNAYVFINSTDPESKKFCSLTPQWRTIESSVMHTGPAAEYVSKFGVSGKKGDPHHIKVGGKDYIAKAVPLSMTRWSNYHQGDVFNIKSLRASLLEKPALKGACFVDFNQVGYIGLDDYSAELITGIILEDVIKGSPFKNHVNTPYTYTICNNWGLYISPLASEADLGTFSISGGDAFERIKGPLGSAGYDALKPEIMMDIIAQVVCTLNFLGEKANYLHGDLKIRNILIHKDKPAPQTFKGVRFGSSGYFARLADFGNSSVTVKTNIGDVRVFSEVRLGSTFAQKFGDYQAKAKEGQSCLAIPIGAVGTETTTTCRSSFWWRLPSQFDTVNLLLLAHSGLPFYKSIDFYVFMVSLMMSPLAYNGGLNDDIYKVWSSLWKMQDLAKVNVDVSFYHNKTHSMTDILSLLRKYEMRCDAMEFAMEIIKTSQGGKGATSGKR